MALQPLTFRCATCDQEHDIDKLSLGADAPVQWRLLGDAERERSLLGGEQCVIEAPEGTAYFVRACLEIPVKGRDAPFVWGVWASLSERSFDEMSNHWEDPARASLGPYFGWFSSVIPGYPDTMYLKTMVHQRDVGQRPWVELEHTDHPLSVDQQEGITIERLINIVTPLLHE